MSYDLNFWKYKPGVYLEHQSVYEQLSDGQAVDGVEELPIAAMIQDVALAFTEGWERVSDESWESEDRGAFQLYTTPQFFRVDCYGMEGEDMNRFIDVGLKYGCPLYDPQVPKRFDQTEPPDES